MKCFRKFCGYYFTALKPYECEHKAAPCPEDTVGFMERHCLTSGFVRKCEDAMNPYHSGNTKCALSILSKGFILCNFFSGDTSLNCTENSLSFLSEKVNTITGSFHKINQFQNLCFPGGLKALRLLKLSVPLLPSWSNIQGVSYPAYYGSPLAWCQNHSL